MSTIVKTGRTPDSGPITPEMMVGKERRCDACGTIFRIDSPDDIRISPFSVQIDEEMFGYTTCPHCGKEDAWLYKSSYPFVDGVFTAAFSLVSLFLVLPLFVGLGYWGLPALAIPFIVARFAWQWCDSRR